MFFNTILLIAQPSNKKWTGTWATAPYEAGTNTPPSPYLANNTLRQIIRVSIGGDTLRVKFSNRTCSTPVTMNSVNIAISIDASTSIIDSSTLKQLKFNGSESVTLNAYSEITSDPMAFELVPGARLAITIYYGDCQISSDMTFHYGSRTDSYILPGDQSRSADFAGATTVERWYHLSSVDVLAPVESGAVAVLGNSITDGYGLHGGPNNRWTHFFSDELLNNPSTSQVSVLNLGIGATWLTTSGVSRFQKDILDQPGLRWIIVFYGVNDIGGNSSSQNIINAYKNLIAQAHSQNIRIYGATITPFKGHSYFTSNHETVRSEVNNWIRTPGNFDKCIDFDKAISDPIDSIKLNETYSNDWLHPNAAGYQYLGESVNVNLFLGQDTIYQQIKSASYYFEAECGFVGNSWDILDDLQASNEKYVTVKSGVQSLTEAQIDSSSLIIIPFKIDTTGNYSIYARLNCPTYDDDSYWVKIDDEVFKMQNGLVTNGWEWRKISENSFEVGDHYLTIAYREDGAKLDKICISNSQYPPSGIGDVSENLCNAVGIENSKKIFDGFSLKQNFPNPFNPITKIEYNIPNRQFVSINIYDILGNEVLNLFDGLQDEGKYYLTFDGHNLSSGVYIYQMKASDFVDYKKLVLLK
ncbi:MAG: T9SS type A sorting domain-containing protein [Ignavibacteriales bacterium]|nr:T9SS type A sorting domain-containing protein [Ignavibacteriales bacterium]